MATTWIQRKSAKGAWRVDSCHFGDEEDGQRALWNLKKANPKMSFRIKEVLGAAKPASEEEEHERGENIA